MFKVLYIHDDARWAAKIEDVDNWEDIAWLVGGALEQLSDDPSWLAFRNDDAVNAGLKFNSRATFLARALGYPAGRIIHGPAVFTGPYDPEGSFLTDVEPAVISQAHETGMKIVTEDGRELERVE